MNTIFRCTALMLVLGLALTACESKLQDQTPEEIPGTPFQSVYRIPLDTDNLHPGEDEILSLKGIESQNQGLFGQVMEDLIADLKAGKLAGMPAEPEDPREISSGDYAAETMRNLFGKMGVLTDESMMMCTEVGYAGQAFEGHSELKPDWLRIVYQDPEAIFPDMNIIRIDMDELQSYRVNTPAGELPLPEAIAKAELEQYMIRTTSEFGTAYVKTYEEAQQFGELIEKGAIDQLSYLPPAQAQN